MSIQTTDLNRLKSKIGDIKETLRTFPEPSLTDRPSQPLRIYFRDISSAIQTAIDIGLVQDFELALRGWAGYPNDLQIKATLNFVDNAVRRTLHETHKQAAQPANAHRRQETKNVRRRWRKELSAQLEHTY